jgi:hypothetical protein
MSAITSNTKFNETKLAIAQGSCMSNKNVIAEVEGPAGAVLVERIDSGFSISYNVYVNDELKQPRHDAEGVIRYLAHCLNGTQRPLKPGCV